MTRFLTALAFTLLAIPAAAQNPCTDPLPTSPVQNPTKIYMTSAEMSQTLPDGSPAITEVIMGQFLDGVNPATGGAPISQTTIPKASFTLVPGTTDCYVGVQTTLASTPLTTYRAAAKVRRPDASDPSGYSTSIWSDLSNPFFRASVPGKVKVVLR